MEQCQNCNKEFEDVNLEKFGSELSKRIYCNECVDKLTLTH
jgi:Fe-S cluster biosynthesis and repair protein YggX